MNWHPLYGHESSLKKHFYLLYNLPKFPFPTFMHVYGGQSIVEGFWRDLNLMPHLNSFCDLNFSSLFYVLIFLPLFKYMSLILRKTDREDALTFNKSVPFKLSIAS